MNKSKTLQRILIMVTVDSLQTKIKLWETENKLLKDDIKNKQKLIDSITVM